MNNIDFLQEVDSQGQAGELSSIPSAEVDLYGRREFEDSTRGQLLTPENLTLNYMLEILGIAW